MNPQSRSEDIFQPTRSLKMAMPSPLKSLLQIFSNIYTIILILTLTLLEKWIDTKQDVLNNTFSVFQSSLQKKHYVGNHKTPDNYKNYIMGQKHEFSEI